MADFKKSNKPNMGTGPEHPEGILILIAVFITAVSIFLGGSLIYSFSPLSLLMKVRVFFAPFFENNLWWMIIISLVFSALLISAIVYVWRKIQYLEVKLEDLYDFIDYPFGIRKFQRRVYRDWKKIQGKLLSENPADWKKAIIDCDDTFDEILKMLGYLEGSVDEKLELITSEQLANIEEIKQAHNVKKMIKKDLTFEIAHQEAERVVGVYVESFKRLKMLKKYFLFF